MKIIKLEHACAIVASAAFSAILAACGSSSPAGNGGGSTSIVDDAGGGDAAVANGGGDDAGAGSLADAADFVDAPAVINPDDGGTPLAFPAPAHGALFGAFVGAMPETQTDSESETLYTNAESLIQRRWVIDNRFYDDKSDWVNDRTRWDIAQHKIPLVTWMPYGNGDPLGEIIAGKHDDAIRTQAKEAKALGVQVLLRWAHEMNGNWYPWGGANNGADASAPAKYVSAWKHVHDLFVAEGATNVVWVWCPLVTDVPDAPWNHWTNYYPGDAYVDWVGLDAYNWGSSSSCCVWQSFTELVDAPYNDYAMKKPIMLPETASAEVGGDKAAWIGAMHQSLMTKYTAIHAVVWFDINKETDWRINSSAPTLAAYKAMALDPYFAP